MGDIDAMTLEQNDEDSVDNDRYKVSSVFVLKNTINLGGTVYDSLSKVETVLGGAIYEGISRATLPELLAINCLNDRSETTVLYGYADVDIDSVYTEYSEISRYDTNYEIYLHTYRGGGLVYTFVSRQGEDKFAFYFIVGENSTDLAG